MSPGICQITLVYNSEMLVCVVTDILELPFVDSTTHVFSLPHIQYLQPPVACFWPPSNISYIGAPISIMALI
jgi:hypothetical protein